MKNRKGGEFRRAPCAPRRTLRGISLRMVHLWLQQFVGGAIDTTATSHMYAECRVFSSSDCRVGILVHDPPEEPSVTFDGEYDAWGYDNAEEEWREIQISPDERSQRA